MSVSNAYEADVPALFKADGSYLGGLDIAVTHAAITASGLTDDSAETVRYAIAAGFTANVMSVHAACEQPGNAGDIVLIGSMSAHTLKGNATVYAGMKAGSAGLSEVLRKEFGAKGVKVALVELAETAADFQHPEIPVEK